jgi:hypothetical protein
MQDLTRTTKADVIKQWKSTIYDIIDEVRTYEFKDNDLDDLLLTINKRYDFEEVINERIRETLDGCENVIYTYNAQKISEIINIYGVFDQWELSGENFKSWSDCAFANIYDLIQNEISIDNLISEYLAKEILNN